MKQLRMLLIVCALWGIRPAIAQTPPNLMNYQGILVDASGAPLTITSANLTFNIYNADAGGAVIWGPQTMSSIPVVSGRFNVNLGPTDGVGRALSSAFGAANAYLEIQVNNNSPVVPRQRVLSTPYAFSAASAANAGNADYAASAGNANYANSAGSANTATTANNANQLGGQAPGYYASAASLGSYVSKGGDTMSGGLNLPANGLNVGSSQLVAASGRVGVNTASPAYTLDVAGSFQAQSIYSSGTLDAGSGKVNGATLNSTWLGLSGYWDFLTDLPPYIQFGYRVRIFPSGYSTTYSRIVGVGTTLRLECNSLIVTNVDNTIIGSYSLAIDPYGTINKVTSSRRYKEQIEPLKEDFTRVLALEPKEYSRKGQSGREIGYLAEDVDQLGLKGVAVYDTQGRPDAIDYPKLVIYANELIKQQHQQLTKQADEIESLRSSVDQLKARLDAMTRQP